jgi:hypothetical protein
MERADTRTLGPYATDEAGAEHKHMSDHSYSGHDALSAILFLYSFSGEVPNIFRSSGG